MASKADHETPTILRKLAVFLVLFYVIYYLASVVFVGAFKVGWTELGRFPFRTATGEFGPQRDAGDNSDGALGAWLAMVVTYLGCLGLAYWVVRVTRRTWDYLSTTSITHWVLCCIINQAFPTNWVWWLTILLATLVVSVAAEFVIYQLRDKRDIETGR